MKYFGKTRIDMLIIGIIIFVLLPLAGGGEVGYADSVITIHLDYKIVLHPTTGARPGGVTNATIEQSVADMNALVESYWRGYRFVIDRIVEVGAGGSEPSQWYDVDFFNAPDDSSKGDLEKAAEGNTALYGWVQYAINMYITNGFCGGISSFPPTSEIIIIGECSADNGAIQLHEIGHYFDLCHSQGCPCGGCDTQWSNNCACGGTSCTPLNNTGACATSPASDGINDTLEDLPCWSLDAISFWNYNSLYANLTGYQQWRVDVAATNNMSYHHQRPLCNGIVSQTSGQLDRWADASDFNANRRQVRDGHTQFVSTNGAFTPVGSSAFPYGSVADGVSAANSNGGDIVLMRPGAYNEQITISKPVTLRATRNGYVYIGTSAPLQKPNRDQRPTRETTVELVERLKVENPTRFDTTGTACGTVRDN